MNYQETVDFLYHKLPFFQKDGASALRPKLDNTLLLCEFLGKPQNKLQHLHIAGTNGKGSTSHILASILTKHGFKLFGYYRIIAGLAILVIHFFIKELTII